MLHCQPSLEQLKHVLRAEICATCPFRVPARDQAGAGMPLPCEAKCPVFIHLPVLQHVAERLDPMVGHHEHAVNMTIRQILENEKTTSKGSKRNRLRRLRYHRRRLAGILSRHTV
jgi:hypothetical protein